MKPRLFIEYSLVSQVAFVFDRKRKYSYSWVVVLTSYANNEIASWSDL